MGLRSSGFSSGNFSISWVEKNQFSQVSQSDLQEHSQESVMTFTIKINIQDTRCCCIQLSLL